MGSCYITFMYTCLVPNGCRSALMHRPADVYFPIWNSATPEADQCAPYAYKRYPSTDCSLLATTTSLSGGDGS